jgi:hypothetical protein
MDDHNARVEEARYAEACTHVFGEGLQSHSARCRGGAVRWGVHMSTERGSRARGSRGEKKGRQQQKARLPCCCPRHDAGKADVAYPSSVRFSGATCFTLSSSPTAVATTWTSSCVSAPTAALTSSSSSAATARTGEWTAHVGTLARSAVAGAWHLRLNLKLNGPPRRLCALCTGRPAGCSGADAIFRAAAERRIPMAVCAIPKVRPAVVCRESRRLWLTDRPSPSSRNALSSPPPRTPSDDRQ